MVRKIEVDARGMECPKPVIFTKKAIEENRGSVVTSIVDNETARENILKFAKSQNMETTVMEQGGTWYIDLYQQVMEPSREAIPEKKPELLDLVILVGGDLFGDGDRELGEILMRGYMYTLTESKPYPKALLFVNSGVMLTLEDSTVLDHLRKLESEGVQILSCGTCLDFYKVKDKLAVGGVGNMYAIVELMNGARNSVRL